MVWVENKNQVVSDLIDGEMMLLNMEAGNYFSLGGSGAALWSCFQQGADPERLLEAIRQAYPDQESASRDFQDFLELLKADELLVEGTEDAGVAPVLAGEYQAPSLEKYSDLQDLLLIDPIHEADESGWPSVAS